MSEVIRIPAGRSLQWHRRVALRTAARIARFAVREPPPRTAFQAAIDDRERDRMRWLQSAAPLR